MTVFFVAEDDSDEEDAEADTKRGRRRTKKSIEKSNMKGETALHRACIKQDLAAVRLLLQQVRPPPSFVERIGCPLSSHVLCFVRAETPSQRA